MARLLRRRISVGSLMLVILAIGLWLDIARISLGTNNGRSRPSWRIAAGSTMPTSSRWVRPGNAIW